MPINEIALTKLIVSSLPTYTEITFNVPILLNPDCQTMERDEMGPLRT